MIVVLPSTIFAMLSWTIISLSGSSALVASSSSRMDGRRTRARAIARRCFCPPERLTPPSSSDGVVALRQPLDELLGAGLPGGPDDLLEGRAGLAGRDVVADRAAKQEAVLQHHAHVAAQMHLVQLADLVVVDADQAALGRIEALQQPHQRALAGAAAADDPDDLPGRRSRS